MRAGLKISRLCRPCLLFLFRWGILCLLACLCVERLEAKSAETSFDLTEFGKLPVLLNGRLKPLDTVARNTLLLIHHKQSLRLENGEKLPAIHWMAELMFQPEQADERKVFRIHNQEVLDLLGLSQTKSKLFSLNDFNLETNEPKLRKQAVKTQEIEQASRTPFQKAISKLSNALLVYQRLKNSLRTDPSDNFIGNLDLIESAIKAFRQHIQSPGEEGAENETAIKHLSELAHYYQFLAENAYFLSIPVLLSDKGEPKWHSTGIGLLQAIQSGEIHPAIKAYTEMGAAFREKKPGAFHKAVRAYRSFLQQHIPDKLFKLDLESAFNRFAPFYKSLVLYVVVFTLACVSWLVWPRIFGRLALFLLLLSLVIHTGGLLIRMYLVGRPPVTNLYSSAIFIGWGSVLLGSILEYFHRNGIGSATAGAIGFLTLIIAHHLSMSGDTLEMMRAVLDSNYWLATHVVVITLGYASTFLAGFLAIIYILRALLTTSLSAEAAKTLARMVYGTICFATLFSTIGTILGGIWADQSWGRFWGWDPKENGALLIVLWNAIILHSRWGGLIRQRGLMMMAVFGNIITSWSWFGTNMLGIGLHSYGFMDSAFNWLLVFVFSQLLLMALGSIPKRFWRSQMNA